MHGLDTSNVSSRVESSRVEPSGIWALRLAWYIRPIRFEIRFERKKNDSQGPNFNALIVWKRLIDMCFSIKSSLHSSGIDSSLYEIPKNDLVDDTSCIACGHRSCFPNLDVHCHLIETRRKTSLGKSWKHTILWFPGASSHYRWWIKIKIKSNYFIVRLKVDQRAGQLSLPHLGITKTEK